MGFEWYKILDNDLDIQQGDFISNCPIVIPPSNLETVEEIEIEVKIIDSIILSQSCDLVNGKIEIVLVCPHYPLKTFIENLPPDQQSRKAKKRVIDNLKKGYLPSYHLLNKDDSIDSLKDYQVVDFRNVYGIQFSALTNIVSKLEKRIRLLPPYREHLSQAFARYFMRVGLPQDIVVEGY